MTINFSELQQQILQVGQVLPQRERKLRDKREQARSLLSSHAADVENLRAKVLLAAQQSPTLRCAIPESDPLDTKISIPSLPPKGMLLAVDGSQIAPNRHRSVDYYLINIGVILLRIGTSAAPQTWTRTQLYYGDDLYTPTGMVPEGLVTFKRDLAERRALVEHLPPDQEGVITLIDGPLELWGAKESSGGGQSQYREGLDTFKAALTHLQESKAIVAGYVDKPRADMVVRMLEVGILGDDNVPHASHQRSLLGVTDADLFAALLAPGDRSAVFGIQSQASRDYTADLAIHFFYLNVGRVDNPWLARVEIPKWVTQKKSDLDILHATLIHQCRTLGARPYPYLLHRAHETAVVTETEKEQVTHMLSLELRRHDIPVGQTSAKQGLKSLSSSPRYSP